ncbi:MAG: Lipoprotein E [Fimbriimonadaceae bacterium]|nr:Lipoprotein E [Fimbriimonadaceae bacterium]
MRGNRLFIGLGGLVVGLTVGTQMPPAVAAVQDAVNPQERVLDANLWMQSSGEYRALCLQTYRYAAGRLKERLKKRSGSGKAWAVVLDLDETVIDNSGFQSFLDRNGLAYSELLWEKWESEYPQEVRLVPGAKAFIGWLESEGVVPVYISNRLEKNRASTIQAVEHLGLSTAHIQDRLLLKTTTSDKTERRAIARDKFEVVMLIGDNLRDFSEVFVMPKFAATKPSRLAAVGERAKAVDRHQYRFGGDFIVFPNPVYGEWQKPFFTDPRDGLRPTSMTP